MSRYRFKPLPHSDFLDTATFETRDAAQEWAIKFSRKGGNILMFDTHDSPHRLVGAAEKGRWRHPVAICKSCKGKTWLPNGDLCADCGALGCILEKLPWSG